MEWSKGKRRTKEQSAGVAWDKFHNTPIYATGLQYIDRAYFRTSIPIVSFKNYHIISTKTKHIIASLTMRTKQKESNESHEFAISLDKVQNFSKLDRLLLVIRAYLGIHFPLIL